MLAGRFAEILVSTVDKTPDVAALRPDGLLFDHGDRATKCPIRQRQRLGHFRHSQLYFGQMRYVLARVIERLLFVARFAGGNGR